MSAPNPFAFPVTPEVWASHPDFHGMTLRDYFAAQILPTIYPDMQNCGDIARAAYHMADVMLAERAKATDETKG